MGVQTQGLHIYILTKCSTTEPYRWSSPPLILAFKVQASEQHRAAFYRMLVYGNPLLPARMLEGRGGWREGGKEGLGDPTPRGHFILSGAYGKRPVKLIRFPFCLSPCPLTPFKDQVFLYTPTFALKS